MKSLEVLSPAGDIESFWAAINSGADAVYLGLKGFNARDKAENFTTENIAEYVKIAHTFGVKVYLTLNTIVTDDEIENVLNFVRCAVDAKIDAFIVQDLGIAHLLKNKFKNINLHASTQMAVHNLYGAKILEELGFARVVLSRETTLKDILDISHNTNLEIEFFVQGAMCVAFSGNCYYSSLCNQESGNRGRCLQLCRLEYNAKCGKSDEGKGYFISPVDNCMLSNLQALKNAGVVSLKIEGRMRRPGYVATATSVYRNAVDNIQKSTNFEENEALLKKVFYRGDYNKGFYLNNERNKETINPAFQNHRGVLIGKVLKVENFKDIYSITIQTNDIKINKNDGIKFVNNKTELSMGVGNVDELGLNKYKVYSKTKPQKDDKVYKTLDAEFENEILENKRKIKVNFLFEGKENKPAKIKATCGKHTIETVSEDVLQIAKTSPIKEGDVIDSLHKLNDTFFEAADCEVVLDKVFIAKSQLNALRRDVIQKLEKTILDEYNKKLPQVKEVDFSVDVCKSDFDNHKYVIVDEFCEYVGDVENIIFAPTNFTLETANKMKQFYKNKTCYLNLPNVAMFDDFAVVDEIVKSSNLGIVANNLYGLYYKKYCYKILCGFTLNIANKYAANVLKQMGVRDFVSSIEDFAKDFNLGCAYRGTPMVMTFCHCPYKTVKGNAECKNCKFDNSLSFVRNGLNYPVRRTKIKNCYFELLFNKEILTKNTESVFIDLRK